jgi:hypothetical protein
MHVTAAGIVLFKKMFFIVIRFLVIFRQSDEDLSVGQNVPRIKDGNRDEGRRAAFTQYNCFDGCRFFHYLVGNLKIHTMETKTYITLSRLAALLLLLSCGFWLPAQTVNYTYDNAGNRTGRTVSPAANAAPSPVAFSVDTALLSQAASARQLAPDRRRRAAAVRESLAGKAIGKHSDAVSEAMEREHEERIAQDPEVVIVGKIMRHVLLVFLFENNDVMIFGIDSNPNKDGVSVRRVKVEDLLFGSDFSSYQRYSAKQLKERSQRSKEFYRIFTSINPLFFEKTNKDKIIILDNFILRNSQYFVESP